MDHLGEPDDRRDDEVKYQGYWVNVSNGDQRAIFNNFATDEKGAGFDLLPLLDISVSDFTAWMRGAKPATAKTRAEKTAKAAAGFEIMVLGEQADDGRIARYLETRALPVELVGLVALTTRPKMKDSVAAEGPLAMVAWATDDADKRLAGQVLQLDENGRPLLTSKGKKLRLTYKAENGWAERSAFHIPAEAGSEGAGCYLDRRC